jgi:hypothetical protein
MLARLLTAALAVYAATLLGGAYLIILEARLALEPVADEAEWARLLEWSERVYWTGLLAYLACGILFLIWFYRACARAWARAPESLRYRPRWALFGFFVPVLSLWRPYLLAVDLFRATRGDPEKDEPPRAFLPIWWGAWIGASVLYSLAAITYWDLQLDAPATALSILSMVAVPSAGAIPLHILAEHLAWVPDAANMAFADRLQLTASAVDLFGLALVLVLVWKITSRSTSGGETPPARVVSSSS